MNVELHKTSEATIKRWVKDVLKEYDVYWFCPVQAGIGAAGVDFHCVIALRNKSGKKVPLAFFIETKRWGKELTDRQINFAADRLKFQGAVTFAIDGAAGVAKLKRWLETIRQTNEAHDG